MRLSIFNTYLCLLTIHYVGDFICQTHWQASNKSKRLDALSKHVLNYTLVLFISSIALFWKMRVDYVLIFISMNGLLHFITDYITSKISAKLGAKQEWHNFFLIIGLDQLIHQLTLALTLIWITF